VRGQAGPLEHPIGQRLEIADAGLVVGLADGEAEGRAGSSTDLEAPVASVSVTS
jgi:hypothetical protein